MNPERATIVSGRFAGPRPRPSAQLIAVPCEKPPSTIGWGRPSRSSASATKLGQKVSGSGVGIPPSRYQCAPPGGSASGPRGVTPCKPALGVERVEERVEVVFVGAAAVEQDERSLRLARSRPLEDLQGHPRGFGSGVSAGSICSRRCSNAGGNESRSPRCSGSSSVAKPGPSVASSKRIPFGSRK